MEERARRCRHKAREETMEEDEERDGDEVKAQTKGILYIFEIAMMTD